jgi:hypothetical protein
MPGSLGCGRIAPDDAAASSGPGGGRLAVKAVIDAAIPVIIAAVLITVGSDLRIENFRLHLRRSTIVVAGLVA